MNWGALTGVAFVAVAILSLVVGGEPPEASEPVREVVDHYVDNKDSIELGAALATLAGLLLIFFAANLRKVLHEADDSDSILPAVVLAGASVMAVGVAIDAMISFALAEAADDIRPTAVQALQALWDNDFFPIALGTTAFMLAAGLSIVLHGGLPKWLGWIAVLFGVVGLTPVGFIGFLGGALWILVVSVLLARRRTAPPGVAA
jgi:hypothetical protein